MESQSGLDKQVSTQAWDAAMIRWRKHEMEIDPSKKMHIDTAINHASEVFIKGDKSLFLNGFRLCFIDPEITTIKNLEKIEVCFNELKSIPVKINNFNNLEYLNLSYNKIEVLPDELWCLTRLKFLYLSNNELSGLSHQIRKLTNLIELDVDNNKLTELPNSLWHLTSLTHLGLANCQLSNLPVDVVNLHNLKKLDLSWNEIGRIPPQMSWMKKLEELHLEGNPLVAPPFSLLDIPNLSVKLPNEGKCSIVIAGLQAFPRAQTHNESETYDLEGFGQTWKFWSKESSETKSRVAELGNRYRAAYTMWLFLLRIQVDRGTVTAEEALSAVEQSLLERTPTTLKKSARRGAAEEPTAKRKPAAQ